MKMIDILIAGLVVVAAIVGLIIIFVQWRLEKSKYGKRREELIDEARRIEHSSLVD